MNKSTQKKIEYLESNLIYRISVEVDINEENVRTTTKIGYRDVIDGFIFIPGILFILIFVLIQLPFLFIKNLICAFISIKNGIPFKFIAPIFGAAKRMDLINNKIKIEMRHREHAPPHYHVIIDDSDYSINIATGEFINDEIKNHKQLKAVKEWHAKNKKLIIKVWNDTRPSDCTVGRIKEY